MSTLRKLQSDLAIVAEVRSLATDILAEASRRIQGEGLQWSLWDNALIALALKMYGAFERLVEDAREQRSSAMQHLKTLVESLIYFAWVVQIPEDTRARLVLAESLDEKLKFFRVIPGYADAETLEAWEKMFRLATQGLEKEWKEFSRKKGKVEHKASEVEGYLPEWYNHIYRLACEPTHMTDLVDYLPTPQGSIRLGGGQCSPLWALVALDYGLAIMWWLLKACSDGFGLGLSEKVDDLESRHTTERMAAEIGQGDQW